MVFVETAFLIKMVNNDDTLSAPTWHLFLVTAAKMHPEENQRSEAISAGGYKMSQPTKSC